MSDVNTVVAALDTLLFDTLGDQIDAATKTKITLYSGLVGSLLGQALPMVSTTIDWSAIVGGITQVANGIDVVLIAARGPVVTASDATTPAVAAEGVAQ